MRNLQTLAVLAALIATPMTAQTVVIHPTAPGPATETINFALQNGGKLKVATVNGTIKISAWDKDEVDMTANFKPSSDDQHVSLEIDSKNNSLELIVKHPKNKNKFGPRESAVCDIELKVPRRVISNISTVNGKIELDSIVGRTKASTVNGTIFLGGIGGDVDADTVNGSISGAVQNIEKMLDCSTVNGSIDLKLLNPNGMLNISTVNGKIDLKLPGAKDIEINRNDAKATFGGGSAKMKFSTVNGSVSVQ